LTSQADGQSGQLNCEFDDYQLIQANAFPLGLKLEGGMKRAGKSNDESAAFRGRSAVDPSGSRDCISNELSNLPVLIRSNESGPLFARRERLGKQPIDRIK
jgi:hypothetical protein